MFRAGHCLVAVRRGKVVGVLAGEQIFSRHDDTERNVLASLRAVLGVAQSKPVFGVHRLAAAYGEDPGIGVVLLAHLHARCACAGIAGVYLCAEHASERRLYRRGGYTPLSPHEDMFYRACRKRKRGAQ